MFFLFWLIEPNLEQCINLPENTLFFNKRTGLLILLTNLIKQTKQSICPEQHGFRKKGLSCKSQLIWLVGKTSRCLERGQDTGQVVMNLPKAFDKVAHSLVLRKTRHYCITGQVNAWIKSFLASRHQAVVVEGAASCNIRVS